MSPTPSRSQVFQLAEKIRGVPEWNALGIDGQAASLLGLPFLSDPTGVKVPEPVPYTERDPEVEDLDGKGKCWRFNPAQPGLSNPFLVHDSWVLSSRKIGTHWLPHDAPCLPANFTPLDG